ncbi:MAG: glycine betaine/L-proline ABC transporter substrate-binding protein ProX [Proteobacteria bacterium]|nr:glycine betaine/L-proline ABC transporter substrate-binding protein ProX [Pseudomonadota bacterium]MBU1610398.1 glycine betaine/L-proline ABC transporter substrate-binding protein ProX [Pseudomonadota bacterium]
MLLAMTIPALAADLPGKGVTVQPARATWTTAFFLEALYSRALKDLGFDVKAPKDLAVPIFYQSVMQGDVDFWANGWFPLHDAQLPKDFDKGATIAGTVAGGGALQGYLVSKRDADKFNITSVADFARPEVKKHFDTNGDGKADMISCPPGWGCEKANTTMLKDTGLGEHINQIQANYSAAMADGIARYSSGGPIFFYTWTPNWTVFKLQLGKDVVWINVPEKGYEDTKATGVEGAATDPIYMGYAPNDINVVANKKFLTDNPSAAKMFKLMNVKLLDIFNQNNKMFEGEDKRADIDRHVEEWIAANKVQYDAWLAEAIAAK